MKEIGLHDLDDLALGSVFLATGGGGDPHIPLLIAREAIKEHGPVPLIKAEHVSDEAYVVPIGSVGAPTVSLELLPSLDEASLVAAAGKGLPVIDGDGMGRALPEAQMMSYAIAGVKPTPALAYDYAGNQATFQTDTTEVYERHIRSYAMAAGGMVTTVEHGMTGAELKQSVIPGTVSFSVKLGQTLRENRGRAEALISPLKDIFASSIYGECRLIFQGKVTDKSTRIIGGYDVGEATINHFDGAGEPLKISIKNEYLLAKRGNRIVASVPDLIVIVEYETGTPINAERLRYGQRVAVFAIGCPKLYRSKAALKAVAPRCFGFDIDYVPLEELHK